MTYLRMSRTNGDLNEHGEWGPNMVPIEDREFSQAVSIESESSRVSVCHYDAPKDGRLGVFQIGIQIRSGSVYVYANETELRVLRNVIDEALLWCDDCREDA